MDEIGLYVDPTIFLFLILIILVCTWIPLKPFTVYHKGTILICKLKELKIIKSIENNIIKKLKMKSKLNAIILFLLDRYNKIKILTEKCNFKPYLFFSFQICIVIPMLFDRIKYFVEKTISDSLNEISFLEFLNFVLYIFFFLCLFLLNYKGWYLNDEVNNSNLKEIGKKYFSKKEPTHNQRCSQCKFYM